jgi:hypothetical protein
MENVYPHDYESMDQARAKAAISAIDHYRGYDAPRAWDED